MVCGSSLRRAALSAALLLGGAALGLFPDEAGKIDWYQAQIGAATKVVAHAHNGTTGIYAATELGVLAAVDADSGALRWRQLVDEDIGTLQVRGGQVLTQSGAGGSRVRVWDAVSGSLAWEHAQPESGQQAAGGAALFVSGSDDVVAAAGDSLVRLAPGGGAAVWELALNGTGTYRRLVQHGDAVFAIGERAGGGLRVVEAELASGTRKQQYDVADGAVLGAGHSVVLDAGPNGVYVVWRDEKDIVWKVHRLGLTRPMWDMYHAKIVQQELMPEDMLGSTLDELEPIPGGRPRFTLTYLKDGVRKTVAIEIVATGDQMDMRKLAAFRSGSAVVGGPAMAGVAGAAVAVRAAGGEWRVYGAGARKAKSSFAYAEATHGAVVWAGLYRTAAGATRALVRTSGGLLAALDADSGEPLWVRNEALAYASDMAFLDLPPPASAAEHAAQATDPAVVTSAAARFVLRWVATGRELAAWASSGFGLLAPLRADAARPTPAASGDHFGFHKLAVFGTRTGVVTALGTQGGAAAWARHLAVDGAPVAVERVFVVRRSQPLGDAPPVVVAVGRSARNATVVAALDALTGAPVAEDGLQPMPFSHVRAFALPAVGADGQQLLGLVTDDARPTLAVWPATAAAEQAFCAAAAPFFFELGDAAGSTQIRGYRVACDGGALSTALAWTFDVPGGEALAAAAVRYDGAQSTALLGRVLGDRSVRYKYINPHVGTLAAQRADGSGGVSVYLYDRVSGRLLHTAHHAAARVDAAHRFLATQTENRVIYQLWHDEVAAGSPVRGYVTVVADLFESERPDERDARPDFSSLDLRLPSVVAAAFVAPEAATALGTTRTASHITARDVVFALESGKLLALPDPLLDPRRPTGAPSADEQAEGLVPYAAQLPLDPRRVLSHGHAVARVRRVVSAPTHLESTSLVAAYGLDLFFTRVSPSGTFDQLSPSFSKLNLAATTLALAVGCLLGGPMVRRRLAARAWA